MQVLQNCVEKWIKYEGEESAVDVSRQQYKENLKENLESVFRVKFYYLSNQIIKC